MMGRTSSVVRGGDGAKTRALGWITLGLEVRQKSLGATMLHHGGASSGGRCVDNVLGRPNGRPEKQSL